MKTSSILTIILFVAASFVGGQAFSQRPDKAADKQKQANLEKNKARQRELQKKYNSMTPEQAAAAKARALEYKRGGYRQKQNFSKNPAPAVKQPTLANPANTAAASKPAQPKLPVPNAKSTVKPLNQVEKAPSVKTEPQKVKIAAPEPVKK